MRPHGQIQSGSTTNALDLCTLCGCSGKQMTMPSAMTRQASFDSEFAAKLEGPAEGRFSSSLQAKGFFASVLRLSEPLRTKQDSPCRESQEGRGQIRMRPRPSRLSLRGVSLLLFTSSRHRQGEANQGDG